MAAKVATPSQVRTWALANGHKVGARGRFHSDIIDAYNKSNKVKYETGVKPAPGTKMTLKVKRTNDAGKTYRVSRTVSSVEIRQAAIDAGIPLGSRGRMPQSVIEAYTEDTLADLAKNWDSVQAAKVERKNEAKQTAAQEALAEDEAGVQTDSDIVEVEAQGPVVVLEAPSDGEQTEISL